MKIYRKLVTNKNFWGFVRMRGGGYRFGFSYGWFEWGNHAICRLWLPRK